MSKRAAAVALATMGFRVFLCGMNDKTPAIAVVNDKAVSDPAQVYSMWSDSFGESRDNNIGLNTDDLLILDFDAKGGREIMEREFAAYLKVFKFKHVVITRDGGYHVYLRLPEGVRCAGGVRVKALGDSIDVRSWHNYVIAPGSDVDGMAYSWLESIPDGFEIPASTQDLDVADPDIIEKCGQPTERAPQQLNIEWDTSAAIAQAKEYLLNHAPPANQGQGGDEITYKVACRVRDFGVSQEQCYDMLLEHWNEQNQPPWGFEELEQKVDNAYRYAKASPHVPGSEYDPVEINKSTPATNAPIPADCPRFVAQTPFDPAVIPKRTWVVEGVLAKGFVTLVNAPPGVGKTQWLAQLLLGIAFNNSEMTGYPIKEPVNVWSFNAEDDINELKRRIGGAVIGHGLKWEDQINQFAISSGIDSDFRVARWDANKQRVVKNEAALKAFAQQIRENNVGAIILDPLADLHEVPESNNDAIKEVVKIFTELAVRTNTAVAIATHSRKQPGTSSEGHAGNAESVRGGSAQVAKARIVLTLMPMSQKDAKAAKIDLADQGSYVRIDSAKGNLGPTARGAKPKWFKFEGVPLGNGDNIGVLKKADLAGSRVEREEEESDIHAGVLADILAGMPRAIATPGAPVGATGVSWSKDVLPLFAEETGLAESSCKKWFLQLADTTVTGIGEIRKIRKAGAGGSILRFFPIEDQPETGDDHEDERSCYTLDA